MKKIVVVASLLIAGFANAQNNLTILYKQGKVKNSAEELKNFKTPIKWSGKFSINEFTVKDSTTFYETVETLEETDEFNIKAFKRTRKSKILGKAFVANTVYCDYAKGFCLESIEHKDENYLVRDTIPNKQKIWDIVDEQKLVFGYACKKAQILDEAGQPSLIVWYTENFQCSLSNDGDNSLPGTILESLNVKTNVVTTAIDVQIDTSPMMVPSKGVAVSKSEFIKIKKGKK